MTGAGRPPIFRERQIYYRVDGEVHFVALSPKVQAASVFVLALAFLWVAYATVNLAFNREIIAAKNRRIAEIRANYEARLADTDRAAETVLALLRKTEDEFAATIDSLQGRQSVLDAAYARRETLGDVLENVAAAATSGAAAGDDEPSWTVPISPTPADPTARGDAPPPPDAAFDGRSAGAFAPDTQILLEKAAAQRTRQDDAMDRLERDVARQARILEHAVAGLNVPLARVYARNVGGPYLPTADADGDPKETGLSIDHHDLDSRLDRVDARFAEAMALGAFLETTPLSAPLAPPLRLTSPYGPRRDPFTGERAFHSGLDYGGRLGAPIFATAPGIVTRAEVWGPYGKVVEIDHGDGFSTRYAHLHKLLVKEGDPVAFQQRVGLLGSTGRSTGPHLHYEVLFDGLRRDPILHFKAARNVFQE